MLVKDLTLQILHSLLPEFEANQVRFFKTEGGKTFRYLDKQAGRWASVYDPGFLIKLQCSKTSNVAQLIYVQN